MNGRLSAAVLLLGLTLACARTPAPVLPSPPPAPESAPARTSRPDSLESLRSRVADLLADPTVSAGTWGVSVRSLATHQPLVEINPHRLLTPASTMKTLTLAVTAAAGHAGLFGDAAPTLAAWAGYDAVLALGLWRASRRPARRLFGLLAGAATVDAGLSLVHLAQVGLGAGAAAAIARGLATAAPTLGAVGLWWARARLTARR